ncbi:MAG: hypothetical protein RLZ98_324 [Pseudomonadota bacterium]|jgi:8-amino-7-oxononanoate synthase
MLERIEKALQALDRRGRRRALSPACGLDFSSNDYLALAGDTALRQAVADALDAGCPIGAGASRLLRGNHPLHAALEARAAAFFGSEAALFLGGGYLANLALWSTLPGRDDLVVYDEFSHASTLEGIRAGRARAVPAVHNAAETFENQIIAWRANGGRGCPWIAVESLYSMDGDRAPLDDLAAIADRHDGCLVVDEAHATGVYGERGRGLAAHLEGRSNIVTVHTCGKALGAMGALISGPQSVIDFLVNRARPFIYATAPSPLMAAAVDRALTILEGEPDRRERLQAIVELANTKLEASCGRAGSGSQIIPVVVGQDRVATDIAGDLQAAGFDVRAIRPPTVPEGTARLRISLTLNVTVGQTTDMLAALAHALEKRR